MPESKSSPLEIELDRSGDNVTLVVTGEIDLESSTALGDALDELVTSPTVLLDLSGVGYMDSTGLRTILVAKEAIERTGGTLRISAASNIVTRLIEISGVGALLTEG
jgi:anti-sigma B factor antagonist